MAPPKMLNSIPIIVSVAWYVPTKNTDLVPSPVKNVYLQSQT